MKIALDAQLLFEKQKTGIGWTAKMLIDQMVQDKRHEYQLNCFNFCGKEGNRETLERYRAKGCAVKECRWLPASVYNHLERALPFPYRWVFGKGADLTQFFNYTLPFGVGGKRATMVYDMAYKVYPAVFPKKTVRWLDRHLEAYCRRADVVITISRFSKGEIMKYLGVPEGKIQVVHCGVDLGHYRPASRGQVEAAKEKYGTGGDYILYLGTLEPRKNIEGLVKAYALLKKDMGLDCPKLVVAGKKGWLYHEIFRLSAEKGLGGDMVFTGYVPEADVPALMGGAMMFVFPSRYEGFGMPPLEAMACGTAVVASDVSSLPEVVGDAGILVDPDDTEGLKNSMRRLAVDQALRRRLEEKGLERAKGFSWERAKDQLLGIYGDGALGL